MGRAPDIIIIARHGARLDAADPSWHLGSPTPYDPPLTYGGWNQSKSLGIQIARILSLRRSHKPEALSSAHSNGHEEAAGAANHRQQVVKVHCSPFLRCLQTSIGISAGIAQQSSYIRASIGTSHQPENEPSDHPKPRRVTLKEGPLSSIIEPDDEDLQGHDDIHGGVIVGKPVLRIDSFLGEWLSPDYYEHITPPPDSALMLVSAKAEMLIDEEVEVFQPTSGLAGNFPGGWSRYSLSEENAIISIPSTSPHLSIPSMSSAIGASSRHRASSYSQLENTSGHLDPVTPISSAFMASPGTYNPPVPTYAISASDPIPHGYVAHARDACVQFDCSWDSMKEPQEWGDSGQYGEEWSAMHKRFRGGLAKMIAWYASPESHSDQDQDLKDSTEDDNKELVLVLVTHAAGCNALVGALTNQPVLIDFGQASLTMAVRKDANTRELSRINSRSSQRKAPFNSWLSEEYDIKTLASTDHLRVAPSRPQFASRVPFRPTIQSPSPETGSRSANPRNSSLGSIRRNAPLTSSHRSDSPSIAGNTITQPSPGLWTKPNSNANAAGGSETPKQPKAKQVPLWGSVKWSGESTTSDEKSDLANQGRLWKVSSSTALDRNRDMGTESESGPARELGPKRRWTTNQADA